MQFLDFTHSTPEGNLALDEALLLDAEAGTGGEVLRLWEWPAFAVVLGAGGVLADDVDETACRTDGVPILRRSSGGGTVLLGRGCLLYSLVLHFDRTVELREIPSSYVWILGRVRAALADLRPDAEPAGISDLAAGGRKFSGNAQQRKRTHLLHHGTLLYDFPLGAVERYLRVPPRQPDYRRGRPHAEFVGNLGVPVDEVKRRLRAAWTAEEERVGCPVEWVEQLVAEKYARPEWVRRR